MQRYSSGVWESDRDPARGRLGFGPRPTSARWRQEHPGYLAGESLLATEDRHLTRRCCGQHRYGAQEQMDPARRGHRVLVLANVRALLTCAKLRFALMGAGCGFIPGCCPRVVVMDRSVFSVNPQLYERVGVRELGARPVIARQEDHAEQCQAPQEP